MLQKKNNKKGFTLVEMLIVVAIIAILVAIAIPLFNAQLNKAKAGVDSANLRTAKSLAVAEYYLESTPQSTETYYVQMDGRDSTDSSDNELTIVKDKPTTGYNQAEKGSIKANGAVIQVVVTDGNPNATWVAKGN